jgi:hypothetical protein
MKKTASLILVAMLIMVTAMTSFAALGTITLGADKDTGIYLEGGLLKPGEEYKFPVLVTVDPAVGETPLTDEIFDDYHFRISNTGKGHTVDSMKLTKASGIYYLDAVIEDGYPAKQTEEQYTLKLVKKSDGKTIGESVIDFKTGFGKASDSMIDALDEGDYVEVNNDAPVFTDEQLDHIARINNYKNVTFTNGLWNYTVNITDMPSINMYNNNAGIKEILTKYENINFEFLSFLANPSFTANGEISLDVSDIAEDYGQTFYVYRYTNGTLSPITATYDVDEDTLKWRANTLGRFVISDIALSDVDIVTPEVPTTPTTPTVPEEPNPTTGVDLTAMIVALLAMATLAGATAAAKRN